MEKINQIENSVEKNKENKEDKIIDSKIYTSKCSLLGLSSCPHLGIYQANYDFFFPCLVTHSKEMPNDIYLHLPSQIRHVVGKIDLSILEYMSIDIDDSFLLNHNIETGNTLCVQRVNMVIHPYLFLDLKYLDRDHKTSVYNAIYKLHDNDFLNPNINENVRFIYF